MTSCAFTRGESNSGRESDFGTTPVIPFHHLGDCDLYMPPITRRERETEAGGDENNQLVPKRGLHL